jgi:hypothetical protein
MYQSDTVPEGMKSNFHLIDMSGCKCTITTK